MKGETKFNTQHVSTYLSQIWNDLVNHAIVNDNINGKWLYIQALSTAWQISDSNYPYYSNDMYLNWKHLVDAEPRILQPNCRMCFLRDW